MKCSLFLCLLAVMTFLLAACSMQSLEADLYAADANTESVSNNAEQSEVSGELDELPAEKEENKAELPETDAQGPVPDGTENPASTDVPLAETQPEKPEPLTETDAPVEEEPAQVPTLMLSIDGTPVTVQWEDNETVSELLAAAQNGTIVVSASRYGGFEQVGSLPQSLSRNDVQTTTQPGDIVLYSGNQLVIFFGSNSWSYTRLGHIEGLSTDELTALLDKDIAVIEIKNGQNNNRSQGFGTIPKMKTGRFGGQPESSVFPVWVLTGFACYPDRRGCLA